MNFSLFCIISLGLSLERSRIVRSKGVRFLSLLLYCLTAFHTANHSACPWQWVGVPASPFTVFVSAVVMGLLMTWYWWLLRQSLFLPVVRLLLNQILILAIFHFILQVFSCRLGNEHDTALSIVDPVQIQVELVGNSSYQNSSGLMDAFNSEDFPPILEVMTDLYNTLTYSQTPSCAWTTYLPCWAQQHFSSFSKYKIKMTPSPS